MAFSSQVLMEEASGLVGGPGRESEVNRLAAGGRFGSLTRQSATFYPSHQFIGTPAWLTKRDLI